MFFVRLILVGLLISVAIKILSLVGRYLQSQFSQPQVKADENSAGIKEMVRDPVCGLYIPSDGAVGLINNGKIVHFCSEKCRQKFLNNQG
ncbi:MAG: transcriptional regulator [Desulfomonilaceae bacterium]